MATADELLAMMAEDGTVYDDDICFADQDTRTVAIPERLKIIGVENDDDVAVRRFRVPAICCGTDLSTFEIRVNFENAKKERDCYFVTDAVVDGDCITFSWRVDRVALRYKGKLRFAIHMELLDADGFIEKEWNSTPAHFDVLEGLEVELTGKEEEAARAAATQLVRLLEKEGENQIAAVEAAGAETIASIPEDYTDLASEVDQLSNEAFRYVRHAVEGDSVDDFVDTGLYLVAASVNAPNTPFVVGDGGLIQVTADSYGNTNQQAFNRFNDIKTRVRSASVEWSQWRRAGSDKIGEYSGSFTEPNQSLDTGIRLNKNTRYLIRKTPAAAEHFTTYIKGNTSVSRRFWKWSDDAYFTPANTGNLMLYNYTTSGYAYTGEIGVEVIVADQTQEVEAAPHVYTVGKTAAVYDYTSLTQCLLDLKDDNSPKTIYINEGDYDIYQEYKDAGVPVYTGDDPTYDYIDYCVWIPKNTHIIGRGLVRLMWMPEPETGITYNESATVSPVNCAGSMTLENVEIHCKNGRYCIHDDPKGDATYTNAIKKYINVRCYKYVNDDGLGWRPVIGFGADRSMRYEFHNCIFKHYGDGRAFYMHTRNTVGGVALTEAMSSNLIVSNCVMDTNGEQCVKLGNSSHNTHIRVDFNSCWFSGRIDLINESSTAASTYHNAWDLKLLNCNEVQVNITDPDNLYPPQVYGR